MSPVRYGVVAGGRAKARVRFSLSDALDVLVPPAGPAWSGAGFGRADEALEGHFVQVRSRVDELVVLAEMVVSVMDGVHEAVVRSDSNADGAVGGGPR